MLTDKGKQLRISAFHPEDYILAQSCPSFLGPIPLKY